jgi:hypothetical protein
VQSCSLIHFSFDPCLSSFHPLYSAIERFPFAFMIGTRFYLIVYFLFYFSFNWNLGFNWFSNKAFSNGIGFVDQFVLPKFIFYFSFLAIFIKDHCSNALTVYLNHWYFNSIFQNLINYLYFQISNFIGECFL